jgi:glycosyltransferase involved in cell wall biosynthesis
VYIQSPKGLRLARLLRVATGARIVMHVRSWPCRETTRPAHLTCDRYVAISEAVKARAVAAGYAADRVDVVYNAVNLTEFSPAADRDQVRARLRYARTDFVIGYFGRNMPHKGVAVLLDALGLIAPNALHARVFLCVGDAEPTSPSLLEKMDWRGRVTVHPWSKSVAPLMRACDVVTIPSLVEPFGRTAVEAMACGIPPIASRTGGLVEALGDEFDFLLVEPGSATALAESLLRFVRGEIRSGSLVQRLRESAQRFSRERHAAGLQEAFARALAR